MLVNNLLRGLIDVMVGGVRFEVQTIHIQNEDGYRPQVSYPDANGSHELICDYWTQQWPHSRLLP